MGIDGASFPLVRERSVIQFVVELELRPELPLAPPPQEDSFEVLRPGPGPEAAMTSVSFAWQVEGFSQLECSSGRVDFTVTTDRGFRERRLPEVHTYLEVKKGCELRRTAAGGNEALASCKQALRLFEGCLERDRFGFAAEWASKTKALIEDSSLWTSSGQASATAAKHLGVAHKCVEEEEDEEEMDFDLFG